MPWHAFDAVLVRLVVLAGVMLVGVAFWRIATTDLRVLAGASNAVVVQMAQWAITTVFAAGAALIGLNWYQAEHRYRRDREEVNGRLDQMDARLQVNDDTIGEVASSVRATRVELEQYIQAQARRRFGRNDASMSIIFQYFQELEESTSPYQRQFLFAQLRNYIESQSRDSDFREVVSSPAGLQMVQRIGQIDPNMDNPDAQKILDILTRTGARRG